ncbi:phosphopantetheine-binding protein [Nocardia sp. CDC159]|uniref:Phosphopantetheine-binding protein n=1 Tax=Nocardia pulmonis TaxID=2951408 RepID=A0A9X2E1I2_9NOCA|nr:MULTISPECIES: phosphopantetheine-binding protein [Nocardia]MCM6772497.1 phosphopantetheine-binding protein [Nocardia pulmonis]MCM6784845.1 phosphopantetheine-binding protein [Nocardia sp. CDC159]
MSAGVSFAQLRAEVAAELYLTAEELDPEADLFAAGLDSVRVLALVERWRAAGARIGFMDLIEQPTLRQWWERLRAE